MAQQAVVTLARGLELTGDATERRKTLLKRIHENSESASKTDVPDVVEMVREDRAR